MSDYQHIRVEPISTALGAVIHGIDCRSDLPNSVVDEIRKAWLEHLVVFFQGQDLEPGEQLAFARRFGLPVKYPMLEGLSEFPEVVRVVKLSHEKNNFGGIWHSDTTYLEQPPIGALLLAREVPEVGGDTLFANMYLAYETLSTGLKNMLGRLIVVQSSAKAGASRSREDRLSDVSAVAEQVLEAEHPVVQTHPETGRKTLFVNYGHSIRFKNMTEAESKPLLDYLFAHQTRSEFTCRFQWAAGSMAMWDNRCTQHNPINDYHGFKRVMHRISIN
ncbi:MAG: TauD/TfdA family dioxygenase [Pseudomonadota bacterium]|jgi:taurine dioxygenase|nr:TauD/TfdA family dioxygenase [Pseudomonadota bacterium]MEC8962249.1 TauD/TfdA family dioxygenase [Pseudomonadota bacterium]MEE3280238.1 TauD/TfdA family dioxygenase [Pseudomonadota bacterium]|tara:strand:+ start:150 stop:974 length:825 start_codon:yes stop_codon:yes gene_type:complete